ncbi:MAG: hypothetical protein NTX11_02360 [Candidatus Saccharibacteria bacterium]|nr:hypothetical protein [Candidatus Saccharibacteria bacterium]
MAYKNKADQIAASKRHYDANKEYYLNRNRRYRKELSTYVNKIKEETPCADCKKQYPYYVMDFDHLEGHTKEGLVSFFTKTGRIEQMMKEIEKCEVVCSNCHRARTHNRLQKGKNIV